MGASTVVLKWVSGSQQPTYRLYISYENSTSTRWKDRKPLAHLNYGSIVRVKVVIRRFRDRDMGHVCYM